MIVGLALLVAGCGASGSTPALLMTSDSGRTWRAQPGLQVETLTIVGSQVYRVAYDHGGCPGPWRRT